MRQDGFVSLRAGREPGVLTTKQIVHPGTDLVLNADVRGRLQVELLDEQDRSLAGFTGTVTGHLNANLSVSAARLRPQVARTFSNTRPDSLWSVHSPPSSMNTRKDGEFRQSL